MFGFIIKKNFCDGWDNLLNLLIANLTFLFAGVGLLMLNALIGEKSLLVLVCFVFGVIVLSIIMFAYGEIAAKIADFNGVGLLDFFRAIPGVLKDAVLYGLLISAIIFVAAYAIPYYFLQVGGLFGLAISCLLLWIVIFTFLALQWFIPIRSLMKNNFKKCLRKSFIILFDNTGFTLLVTLYNLVMTVLSVACLGFFPSMGGILIGNCNALRILLYKYDYLEEHPELTTRQQKRKIPWEELIYEDRQTLGPRKFKSFIFPWREEEK